MRGKKGIAILVALAALIIAAVLYIQSSRPPKPREDEIMLRVQLDLKEDIGLLIMDHSVGGHEGGGGVSNADRSLIRHDDVLYWNFYKSDYEGLGDTVTLKMRFRIVTEYCDPNFDNIYPEELVRYLEPITLTADFGRCYPITITGDRVNGYKAVLN
ncbi:MAG: hypothetical protein II161_02160 [Erysipelotrichaceae bacterium]|nr:hypothetical protein [Erysipelotrichaceae bacterium]